MTKLFLITFLIAVSVNGQCQWINLRPNNSGLNDLNIFSTAIDSQDRVWIAYTWNNGSMLGGLSKLEEGNWTYYDSSNSGLPTNSIRSLDVDTLGRLLLGAYETIVNGVYAGLVIYDGVSWINYDTSNSNIISNKVSSIAVDRSNNNIWVASGFTGISVFDGSTWSTLDTNGANFPSSVCINDLFVDSQNRLWVALHCGGGLRMLDLSTNQWTSFTGSNSDIPCGYVGSIAEASDGKMWFGFQFQCPHIASYDGANWEVHIPYSGWSTTTAVKGIKFDQQDNLWVASRGEGLWKYDGTLWKNVAEIPGNTGGAAYNSIQVTSNNNIVWGSLLNGLYTNDVTLDVSLNEEDYFLSLYPNPVHDNIHVESSLADLARIELLSISGTLLQTFYPKQASFQFDMSDYASGMYLIRAISRSHEQVIKIIKE